MTTATIDVDTLNNLLDNQKKLDDIFDSIFDEDMLINNLISFEDESSDQDISDNSEEFSFDFDDDIIEPKKRSVIGFVLPIVIEIAAIYYAIVYLF